MGTIRKQTISSSVLIYIGFAFGAFNTLMMVKQGIFTPEQYGLTQSMVAINQVFFSFSCLGMVSIMGRYYPYYYDSLKKDENDLLAMALVISLGGFILLSLSGYLVKPYFIQKFLKNAPDLVNYYFWLFPFAFFYLIFSILETHSAIYKKTVFPNFLREGAVRMITTLLITLYIFKVISFDLFVKLFSCIYGVTALLLWIFLSKNGELNLVFRVSRVTRKKRKEMFQFVSYTFAGIVIFTVAGQIDSLSIASQRGNAAVAVFSLSQYIATVIQVPQRSVVSIAAPFMAQAWKDNNLPEIQRIYFRSSINLLIISLFIFGNIWLNIDLAYKVVGIDKAYEAGKYVVLILGITKIIDMGTGVNSQLLYTSPSWRFEFYAGMVLFALAVPLNYYLVNKMDIIGAAIANIISITVYNAIRIYFIHWKYRMQPFTSNTLTALVVCVVVYFPVAFITASLTGIFGMAIKSLIFSTAFVSLVYLLKLTPDFQPILDSLTRKLKRR